MGATLTALVLLVLARGHWWPSGNDWYFTAAAGALLLLATGCIWAVSTIIVLRRDHRGAWWMLTWPLVSALGVIVALLSAPRFDNDRPEFEVIARQLLATRDSDTLDSQRIGRFEVDRVYEMPTGEVYFTDSRRGFTSESGWVYSPGHTPAGRDGFLTVENLGGLWYRY
ncbi:hypothetical protein NOU13_32010 [Rhodococcus erythropolis]|uniref:hypothetical protein n=1 Tax=Rhodococcus erythropolis TaxID=1833 RepID=UPI00210BCACE|nr:hypothetical protein [Rhodococcus erythropolis]MCQ4129132.1 hypothetical protein [Rhodococcus erythropolis]